MTTATIKGWVDRVVVPVLIDQVPRDHQQPNSEFRRRRIIAAITLVVGATLLGLSLATDPGNFAFYPLTASVAVVWVAGGFLSGPLHLGYGPSRGEVRRPVLVPVVLGLLSGAVFVVGALVVREIGPIRTIIRHVLATRAGMDVTVLLDPAEALTMAEDHSWDVVVTDVVMPGMSGLELMRRLRQRWPSLPVVTITGRIGVEVATYLIMSEADGMLSKPVDPAALLEVVRRLGGRGQG